MNVAFRSAKLKARHEREIKADDRARDQALNCDVGRIIRTYHNDRALEPEQRGIHQE